MGSFRVSPAGHVNRTGEAAHGAADAGGVAGDLPTPGAGRWAGNDGGSGLAGSWVLGVVLTEGAGWILGDAERDSGGGRLAAFKCQEAVICKLQEFPDLPGS